ncbi:uncharacterized protein LOC106066446 [Biomphalaria glabrata]|uniref:Poly [ADP-ribose] polymerase n=1 Tax=Biomphalaria glabrata TaxID=6526 RepID=A0A9U8EB74_BIOGL|nr:uncharacterized protein LOC106066446 [Biomphalaria glabrata]
MAYNSSPRGTVDFLRYALQHDRESPAYWSTNGKFQPFLVDVRDFRTNEAIKSLVQETWDRRLVGEGRDARGLEHNQIVVLGVERIENATLFAAYRKARRDMLRRQIARGCICPDIATLSRRERQNVLTTRLLPGFMKEDLYHEINEHYVFHGTTVDRIGGLVTGGFNVRQSSDDNLFGRGIYTAEKAIKADQYADPTQNRSPPGNRLKLILCRMLLGNPLVLQEQFKNPLPAQYDSIISEGWMFREFVVKEDDRIYPEYVITYTRQ